MLEKRKTVIMSRGKLRCINDPPPPQKKKLLLLLEISEIIYTAQPSNVVGIILPPKRCSWGQKYMSQPILAAKLLASAIAGIDNRRLRRAE